MALQLELILQLLALAPPVLENHELVHSVSDTRLCSDF